MLSESELAEIKQRWDSLAADESGGESLWEIYLSIYTKLRDAFAKIDQRDLSQYEVDAWEKEVGRAARAFADCTVNNTPDLMALLDTAMSQRVEIERLRSERIAFLGQGTYSHFQAMEAEIERLAGEVDHWRKRATFAEQFIPPTP